MKLLSIWISFILGSAYTYNLLLAIHKNYPVSIIIGLLSSISIFILLIWSMYIDLNDDI